MMQITKMILFAAGLFVGAADTIPTKELLNNKLRRSLHYIVVNCVKFENNTCECPGGCMSYNENRSNPKCVLDNCWEWDIDKTECVENGPSFISAIVLQAIPFTGVFGAGFGNMGRWDLCGVAFAICFGPLLILPLWICCLVFMSSKNNKNNNELMLIPDERVDERGGTGYCAKCFGNCFGCLWVIAIMCWYVYGIIVIANKQIKAPNGCSLHY